MRSLISIADFERRLASKLVDDVSGETGWCDDNLNIGNHSKFSVFVSLVHKAVLANHITKS